MVKFKLGNKNMLCWGLCGVEDFGGGLKVVFCFESGIDFVNGVFDDGLDLIFVCCVMVGLKGKWGELLFGCNFIVIYDYMLLFDLMGYV